MRDLNRERLQLEVFNAETGGPGWTAYINVLWWIWPKMSCNPQGPTDSNHAHRDCIDDNYQNYISKYCNSPQYAAGQFESSAELVIDFVKWFRARFIRRSTSGNSRYSWNYKEINKFCHYRNRKRSKFGPPLVDIPHPEISQLDKLAVYESYHDILFSILDELELELKNRDMMLAFKLKRIAGLSLKQIAEALNQPEATVNTWINRLGHRVRERLEEREQNEKPIEHKEKSE